MMDINKELVLDELISFEKRSVETNAIPEVLEKYLVFISKTGNILFPWCRLKPLIKKKLELVVNEFNERSPVGSLPPLPNVTPFDFDEMKQTIIESFDSFYGAPFTIQRICELITDPFRHYKRTDKYMRGLEKNVLVVTLIQPKLMGSGDMNSTNSKSIFNSLPSSSSPSSSSPAMLVNGTNGTPINGTSCSSQSRSNYITPTAASSLAPLQQLDSFATVFASPPSTPLAVVSDLQNCSVASASSLGHSSDESSSHSETKSDDDKCSGGSSSSDGGGDSDDSSEPSPKSEANSDPAASAEEKDEHDKPTSENSEDSRSSASNETINEKHKDDKDGERVAKETIQDKVDRQKEDIVVKSDPDQQQEQEQEKSNAELPKREETSTEEKSGQVEAESEGASKKLKVEEIDEPVEPNTEVKVLEVKSPSTDDTSMETEASDFYAPCSNVTSSNLASVSSNGEEKKQNEAKELEAMTSEDMQMDNDSEPMDQD